MEKINNPISDQFYRKNNCTDLSIQVLKQFQKIKENPIAPTEYEGINGDTQIWKIFSHQASALQYSRKIGLGLMVFAFEGKAIGDGGKRNFIVCHPRVLWKKTKDRPLSSRCMYEVIPEGQVCKLYFDLEFSRILNPLTDGVNLTKLFIDVINYFLWKEFNIKCNFEDVLDLDSTTEKKFSRHLIYNPSKVAFADNSHMGRFINKVCYDLQNLVEGSSTLQIPNISKKDVEQLFIKSDSSINIFCDKGVYTRNRNFRTFRSTKYGKETPLVISEQNKYTPSLGTDDEIYFLDSLITYLPENNKVLRFENEVNSVTHSKCNREVRLHSCSSGKATISPYAEIEAYIHKYLGQDNLIRSWHYFNQSELLVLEINKQYRFCNNIGREHKSNCVMYVVNLRYGVFYQKCHDIGCQGYRSAEMKLPPETMPWKLMEDSSIEDQNDDDDEELLLLQATERAEKEEMMKANKKVLRLNISTELNAEDNIMHLDQSIPYKCSDTDNQLNNDLPSPWNHLSQIESPSCPLSPPNVKDFGGFNQQMEIFHDCDAESMNEVSDEELLHVALIVEKQINK